MLNGRFKAERPSASVGPPSCGQAALITLYSTGLSGSVQAIIGHPCQAHDILSKPMSSCMLIWLTLHSVPMTSISLAGLEPQLIPDLPLSYPPPLAAKPILCQVLSSGRQWQIWVLSYIWTWVTDTISYDDNLCTNLVYDQRPCLLRWLCNSQHILVCS